MAYEVTATRRRPQNFESLIGQEFVAETLKNSIRSQKIAHAYLFSGPRGCGKTSTARILAKALNCRRGPAAEPCGECDACREITAGSSLDVIEIDGASNTSVNDVRQIKDEVLFPPNSFRYKIYIIDEVHMLSTSAFNALLKTIEEPPPYVVFIFATTELHKVPATIKSRCQQFNFRLVPVEKVKEQLAAAATELGIKAQDEALYWIARESTGSMRDSYTLFDQVAAFSGGEITWEKIRDKLGLVGVDRLNEMFGLCAEGKSEQALSRLDEYLQNGVGIEQLIADCADYLRSLLLIKNGVTKESLLGQSAERFSREVLSSWSNVQLERALSIFMQLYRDIRYSLSPRYEMELAVSRLCWLKDYVSASDVKRAVDAVRPVLMGRAGQGAPGNEPGAGGGRPFLKGGAEPPYTNSAEGGAGAYSGAHAKSFGHGDSAVSSDIPKFSALEADPASVQERQHAESPVTEPDEFLPERSDVVSSAGNRAAFPEPGEGIDTHDINAVRAAAVQDFSLAEEAMLASSLMSSSDWAIQEQTVSCSVPSAFEQMQLQRGASKIAAYLSALYGRDMKFRITVSPPSPAMPKDELPVEVQVLRDAFRGKVL